MKTDIDPALSEPDKDRFPRNVIILGWVSFFTDASSEMILPVLPLFLTNILGAGYGLIGLIEGLAESASSLLKVGSGWYSDRVRRRKPLAVFGYSLSNVVKPLLALTTSWTHVLTIRFIDRIGKGLRTAPRDALIADVSVRRTRGRSFGLHRMMDTLGAAVGASIAFLVLSTFSGGYRRLFALSAIPGFIAVLVLILFVREKRDRAGSAQAEIVDATRGRGKYPKGFIRFLISISVFALSTVSYAFFILRADELGIAERFIPMVYLLYTVVYALTALPAGILSDRIGRVPVLAGGMLLNGLLLMGFVAAGAALHGWILFAVYGLVSAITDTVPRALLSDMVPAVSRGTALGLYHTVVGIVPLPANLLFGLVWSRHGSEWAFTLWALLAVLACGFFLLNGRTFHANASVDTL